MYCMIHYITLYTYILIHTVYLHTFIHYKMQTIGGLSTEAAETTRSEKVSDFNFVPLSISQYLLVCLVYLVICFSVRDSSVLPCCDNR